MRSEQNVGADIGPDYDAGLIRRWAGGAKPWLRAFLSDAASDNNIRSLVALGSAVRQRGHRRSDLDLLIVFSKDRPVLNPPLEVDVRLYEADAVERKLASGHEIIGWAMKFGRALHDKEHYWKTLYDKWKDRIPLPSPGEAAQRARRSLESARKMLEVGDESAAEDLILASATQFVRHRLIVRGVYPASRPELPSQLRSTIPDDPLSALLDDCMYGKRRASDLFHELTALAH
jgi:predicted nucleotidyltransferase